jgi:hypothetical protein
MGRVLRVQQVFFEDLHPGQAPGLGGPAPTAAGMHVDPQEALLRQ